MRNTLDNFMLKEYFLTDSRYIIIFIIYSIPATGKSRLMKYIAEIARQNGNCVEYYFCSSDPSSLDGIIIKELSIGFVDGTAPHTKDPTYPGIKDKIINLGDFWSETLLKGHKDEIISLSQKKSTSYQKVYNYLKTASILHKEIIRFVEKAILFEKLKKNVNRIFSEFKDGYAFNNTTKSVVSFGMDGFTYLDTYRSNSDFSYGISDDYFSACFYIDEIIKTAKAKKLSTVTSISPITRKVEAVWFPEIKLCFETARQGKDYTKRINMGRFIDSDIIKGVKRFIKFNKNLSLEMIAEAQNEFKIIKDTHFKIEEIYISAMDFECKEKYVHRISDEIFNKSI